MAEACPGLCDHSIFLSRGIVLGFCFHAPFSVPPCVLASVEKTLSVPTHGNIKLSIKVFTGFVRKFGASMSFLPGLRKTH